MAKMTPRVGIKLDIVDSGKKVLKTFNVDYKEPSRKEQKQLGKENETILDLFKQNQKLDRRVKVTEIKIEALREIDGKSRELLSSVNTLEKLYIQRDEVENNFEELGGVDKMIEASKETFIISVGGKDKDTLSEYIEENGDYSEYLDTIAKDAKNQKGN